MRGESNVFYHAMASTSKCKVSFSENVTEEEETELEQHETYHNSDSESEFYEITSSKAESICTSDDERLEIVLEFGSG